MARTTGIGGVFLKTKDPETMAAFYRDHLGVPMGDHGWDFKWRDHDDPEREGRTVFALFDADTDYLGDGAQSFMVNLRVDDLDGLLAELADHDIRSVKPVETYDYGRFAWIEDPEGNRIELWEPAGESGQGP